MSIRIDSDTDRAQVALWATAANTTGNPWTVMGWIKIINDRNTFSSLFSLGSGGTDFVAQLGADGTTLNFYDGGAYDAETFALSVGTWYHIAMTRANSGGGMAVYVDGTLRISNSNFNALTGSPPTLSLGYDLFGGDWLDGELCDFRVWQSELTVGEIATEKASATPVKASPWAYWRLAAAASAATDGSGNGHSLTVSGLADGVTEPTVFAGGGATAVSSRRARRLIHPGAGPGGFGKRLRTRRNTTVSAPSPVAGSLAATEDADSASLAADVALLEGSKRKKKIPMHPGAGPYNPMRFRRSARNTTLPAAPAVSGSLAATEAEDASGLVALETLPGTLAATEAADAPSFVAVETLPGTLAATEAADTPSFTATETFPGALSATEAADAAAFTALESLPGTLSATEAADTSSLTATETLSGTLSASEDNDTASFSDGGQLTGSLAATEAADTAGFAAVESLPGTLAATEEGDASSLVAAETLSGSLSATEQADSASFSDGGQISGTLQASEAGDAPSFSALETLPGTLAVSEANDSASLSAQQTLSGALAATEAADTAVLSAIESLIGSLNATEAADAGSFTASEAVGGSLSAAEASDSALLAAVESLLGSLQATEQGDTASFVDGAIYGTLHATEANDSAVLQAIETLTGSIAAGEGADTWFNSFIRPENANLSTPIYTGATLSTRIDTSITLETPIG